MKKPKQTTNTCASLAAFAREFDGSVACPWCGSTETAVRSPFGGTVSEILMQCNSCKSGFGWMKWQGIKPSSPQQQ